MMRKEQDWDVNNRKDRLNIARCASKKVSLDASLWMVESQTPDVLSDYRWQSGFKARG